MRQLKGMRVIMGKYDIRGRNERYVSMGGEMRRRRKVSEGKEKV